MQENVTFKKSRSTEILGWFMASLIPFEMIPITSDCVASKSRLLRMCAEGLGPTTPFAHSGQTNNLISRGESVLQMPLPSLCSWAGRKPHQKRILRAEDCWGRDTTVYGNIMVATCHDTFTQTHKMYITKCEPWDNLWTLGEGCVSAYLSVVTKEVLRWERW